MSLSARSTSSGEDSCDADRFNLHITHWSDTEELLKIAVAHEAGHNLGIEHDTHDDSIVSQVKFGQHEFFLEFRHAGINKQGSTQQMKLK